MDLVSPFVNALFLFYNLTGNLGVAVIVVTILIRVLLLPILLPSLRSAKKMRLLQPKLKKLQEKYKDNKTELAKAQTDFYRENGINPLSGCLPQIFQIGILIVFYNAFNSVILFAEGKLGVEVINKHLLPFLQVKNDFVFNLDFLGTNLSSIPSKLFATGDFNKFALPVVFLLLSGLAQYLTAKFLMPTASVDEKVVENETPKDKEDDMMAAMRTQSLYMMPLMTVVIGWNFSVGLILYWLISSLVVIGQQVLAEKVFKI